jgi:hypothetical protein
MSAVGQKLPTWTDRAMSALHQLATKLGTSPVVRFVPKPVVAASFGHLRGRFRKISSSTWNDFPAPAFVLGTHPRPQNESSGVELQCPRHLPQWRL